ncbi:hypothetical protein MOQ72_29265 [Saccharopolyspora sp. K220]|uniref:hypothetical protein n=1 Tax=Saccharopolyspora soli TaxID=2926618 RepID=UPI001F5AA0E3|nr:hypothetical protein [Saccharopolyspora soli]MCI2421532.1 hypothetical protein [Saccharopolyspora soli]
MSPTALELNHRERATLRAVAAGRVEMTCSCEPDLFVDGVNFSDQTTAHHLAHLGLLQPGRRGRAGARVPAVLTDEGELVLSAKAEAMSRATRPTA